MIIRVSEIPDEGVRVEHPGDLGMVYREDGWRLETVSLRIERRGREVDVTGHFGAATSLTCSRCLESLPTRIAPEVELHLLPMPSARHAEPVELGPDDLAVDFYAGDELDVGRLIRSETDLALPMKPLCRLDCRGLCPVCGGNRNVTDCGCEARGTDPRLAPLEALRRLR